MSISWFLKVRRCRMQSKTTHPPYRLGFNQWAKYIRAEVERMAYGKEVRMAKPVLSKRVQKMQHVIDYDKLLKK